MSKKKPPAQKTSAKKTNDQGQNTDGQKQADEAEAPKEELQPKNTDPLLLCLTYLTKHFGRAKSSQAIRSGLAYTEKGMGPSLFCEAAENMGLKTQIVKRTLRSIPAAVMPVVAILKNDQACVLIDAKGKKARIFMPETRAVRDVPMDKLERDYAGHAIFVHPSSEFTDPQAVDHDDAHRHWFWSVINQNKGVYSMAMLAAVFINLFGLISPLFIMTVYDRVIPNNAIETGWALGIGALTFFFFDLIMRTLRAYMIDVAGRRVDVIAGRRIYDQVLNMKLIYRPKSSGSFANMLRDFDAVRDFFTSATITALVDLPFTILFLFVIYYLGGPIAFVLAGLIGLVIIAGFLVQFRLKSFVRKAVRTSESKHGLLVETIHGLETVKSVGADGRFRARYTDQIGENAYYGQGSRFWSGLGVNVATFLQQISSIVVVLIGMYLVKEGTLSVGELIACVILGGRAIAPIGQIANLMTRYHQAGGALKTLNQIMSQPVERPAGKQFLNRPDLEGKLRFDKVSFTYPNVKRKVLDDVSFLIEPGEKVGVIGRIGSGKTTIARIIMGLYEPNEGTVLADETDYRQIDPADLRRNVAYISQDVVLFTGSVRDNISASVPQATEEQILEASKAAGVHDFISRHPMGYDAPVGEHGQGLSGGQRQAIALARAMLLNPSVMVCDEPTNAMDVQAENVFIKYVEEQIKDRTFILITHKHNMLSLVDRLILMDQGKVVIDGKRDDVIKALQGGEVQVPK